MSNEGVTKVLSDIDKLSEAKLDEVMSLFLADFKDGILAARGWLPGLRSVQDAGERPLQAARQEAPIAGGVLR